MNTISTAWAVFRKEWVDALRDRRTLLMVLLSSVAVGPLVLVLVSTLVSGLERRAEARELVVVGIEHAPTLRNFLERQTFTIRDAPPEPERALRDSKLGDPVIVIPQDFERRLAAGERPVVEVLGSSGNQRASAGVGRAIRLLQAFDREQQTLRLALHGTSPAVLKALDIEERDVGTPSARAAQLSGMVPFFLLMAVLYGALNAALDTTAGERERGSLEPLMMTPAPPWGLVLGKWGAVAAVGMLIAALGSLSFLPAQWLIRSETLAAMFSYGVREAGLFLALLAPLSGALSAVLMALAIRSKSFKEAQASTTVVVLAVSLMPLVTVFNQQGEAPWHVWVPVLGQVTLMGRVLKGDAIGAIDLAATVVVCAALALLALRYVVGVLRQAATR